MDELLLKDILMGEDEIGKVLRTQILVEELINKFLEVALKFPKHLKSLRLDYGKVTLAMCLGLNNELKIPLYMLGKIRNDFAHKINQNIDSNRVNNLFDSFSPSQKKQLMESIKNTSWKSWSKGTDEEKFIALCMAIYFMCKISILQFEHDIQCLVLANQIALLKLDELE